MKTLRIKWQSLISKGQTCKRCSSTEKELKQAISTLKRSFVPLGIKVVLKKEKLSLVAFSKNPSQSNRIWVNDKPLEEWLGARSGQSPCCDICVDSECRTVSIGGKVYEAIPAELIIKVGLIAASQLLGMRR